MAVVKNVKKECHDCKVEIKFEGNKIENGFMMKYEDEGEIFSAFKCHKCFEKNKSLNNFRECEVYSRIVGYLRPVQQWNKGKQQEYKDRLEFKVKK